MRSQTGARRAGLLAALLVGDLADHEHVARTGNPGRDEVEDARQRREPGHARDLEIDVQVFLERLVGAQLQDGEVVLDDARREPGGW